MMIPDGASYGSMLQEAMLELEAAIHDARVAFDCISLGEIDRAHTSAVTARIAIDAAVTAVQAALLAVSQSAASAPGLAHSTATGLPVVRSGKVITSEDVRALEDE
jgi:hypothetical protein